MVLKVYKTQQLCHYNILSILKVMQAILHARIMWSITTNFPIDFSLWYVTIYTDMTVGMMAESI